MIQSNDTKLNDKKEVEEYYIRCAGRVAMWGQMKHTIVNLELISYNNGYYMDQQPYNALPAWGFAIWVPQHYIRYSETYILVNTLIDVTVALRV